MDLDGTLAAKAVETKIVDTILVDQQKFRDISKQTYEILFSWNSDNVHHLEFLIENKELLIFF